MRRYKTLAKVLDDNTIQFLQLDSPLYRLIYDFDPTEVSGALCFIWELGFDDVTIIEKPHPQALTPQLGHHIAWTDETRKYRPLLDMPKEGESKMDQLVRWLEALCLSLHFTASPSPTANDKTKSA